MYSTKRLLMFLCLVTGLTTSFNLLARTVTIATGEYPPWTSQNLKDGGFVNDVIAQAFKREGIDTKFVYLPWKRAQLATKAGEYDATSFWFHSDARAKDFLESQPVMHSVTVFFHLKSKQIPNWSKLSDLKAYTIGATRGYTYTDEFWAASKSGELHVDQANDDAVNLQKLLASRIDLYPTGQLTGWVLINSKFPQAKDKLTTLPKPLVTTNGYLLFPKSKADSTSLVTTFNKGLAAMNADGTIKKLEDKLKSGGYSR